tara:strand:- start:26045 stop:29038 length:2994 start_codon:yes stop_codon:yes gene_type:complete
MKKIISFLVLSIVISVFTSHTMAQGESFAGGEIVVDYDPESNIGRECGDPIVYNVVYKVYRDCLPFPFSDTRTIGVYRQTGSGINVVTENYNFILSEFEDRGIQENICIRSNPACTEGRWYKGKITVPEPGRWIVYNGVLLNTGRLGGLNFHSPLTENIAREQKFFMKTVINNRFCDTVQTRANVLGDPEPNFKKINSDINYAAKWDFPDVLETFCNNKSYEYRLLVRDPDVFEVPVNFNNPSGPKEIIRDRLSFVLTSTRSANEAAVNYEPGYSSQAPFPVPSFPSVNITSFNGQTGVFSFTPQLPFGINNFTAAVTFIVREIRKRYYVETRCLSGNCPTSADSTDILREEEYVINETYRQMRFIIDRQCDNRLPEFESETFNLTENAWEFGCASTTLDFTMTEPMLCSDALEDPKWLSLFRGTPNMPIDDNGIGIDSIIPLNCDATGQFTKFRVYLFTSSTRDGIGPGNYTLFPKPNRKPDGLFNRCGFELEEGSVAIPVFINEDDFEFVFQDGDAPVLFCDPADSPFTLYTLQGQGKSFANAKLFTYQFIQRDPNAPIDSFPRDGMFDIPIPVDPTGLKDYPIGFWKVGIGLDYGYTFNGVRYDAFCYDDDEIVVDFKVAPPIEPRSYDLCAREPWPIINLDSMTNKHNAVRFLWDYLRPGAPVPDNNDGTSDSPDWIRTGGESNTNVKNDKLDVASVGFGVGNTFYIRSQVEFPNGCIDETIFTVRKTEVKVDIGPGRKDTIICPGDQYLLSNSFEYLLPDSMDYEWFIDDQLIPEADSFSMMITRRGMYKLKVTKNTETTTCFGEDSIFVNVADSLGIPEPVCSQVTWKNNNVEQIFYTPPLFGAEDFQVREIDSLDNVGPWKKTTNALEHTTVGAQIRIEIRGVNTEVDEESDCRYGPIALAYACNVIVKPVNIFTPNNDGINDLLRFDLLEVYPGSLLQIYNRWGKLIYENENYRNDWDGEDYPDGTYFYVLDVNDESQGILKGTVTIIR